MANDVDSYLDLITSEHRPQPNFVATLTALLQPCVDIQAAIASIVPAFDLDTAVGVQLDVLGQWINTSRAVREPIDSVYFSFNVSGLGFNEGAWFETGDPTDSIQSLPDDAYRLYEKARVLNNSWDGSIPDAYAIFDRLFADDGFLLYIFDNGDLTMSLGLAAMDLDALTRALFLGGYLDIRPAGVRIKEYIIATAVAPIFALDPDPLATAYGGLDVGAWATIITP